MAGKQRDEGAGMVPEQKKMQAEGRQGHVGRFYPPIISTKGGNVGILCLRCPFLPFSPCSLLQ